jgi:hypothetical protein
MKRMNKVLIALLLSASWCATACSPQGNTTEFRLSVAPEAVRATLDGRVFVLLDDDPDRDPLYSQKYIFARDVRGHDAEVPLAIGRGRYGSQRSADFIRTQRADVPKGASAPFYFRGDFCGGHVPISLEIGTCPPS